MIAIEVAAPIINHRVEVSSDRLPANVASAKIIILYEEPDTPAQPGTRKGPVAELRANPIPLKDSVRPMTRDELYDRACFR